MQHTSAQVIFKGTKTLKSILMHPKYKIPSQLKQNTVYKWPCPEEYCNLSYTGETSRCLENGVKEHTSHVPEQFPNTASPTKTTNKSPEKIEKSSIWESTTLASTVTQEKCTSQKLSTTFLEEADLPMSQTKW